MIKLAASLLIAVVLQISIFGSFRFPNRSTPATCDSRGTGLAYYDTDDVVPYFCNGTSWTSFGVSLSSDNTWTGLNVFERTDAGNDACFGGNAPARSVCIDGDNGDLVFRQTNATVFIEVNPSGNLDFIATSIIIELLEGGQQSLFPLVAGTTGAADQLAITMAAADGNDTYTLFNVNSFSDKDHTGTGNFVRGISVEKIFSPDSDARHIAYSAGEGWEVALKQTTGVTFATLPSTPGTGIMEITFCNDCQGTSGVSGTACATGGSGAIAFSVRNSWICIH